MTAFDFSATIAERTRDFTGRAWVLAEIDQWLANPSAPRFFIITGEPGIGKTAIAARLTQVRELAASHFCLTRQADMIDPLNFTRSLSHQLTRIDGFAQGILAEQGVHVDVHINVRENFGQIIGVQIENLIIEAPSAAMAFNRAVLDPLQRLCAGGLDGQLLILVDALDEAAQQHGPETIVDLLANARGLPPQVRFVLTSRPEGAVLRHFEQLNIPHLVLDAGREENLRDVRAYVRRRIDASEPLQARLVEQGLQRQVFIERVTEASKGNFLYLVWLLPAIVAGTQRFDALEALPVGLDGIYREFLRTRTMGRDIDRWRDHYRPLLSVLAVARVPLTIKQLLQFTGLSRQAVKDLLLDVQQFLDPSSAEEGQYQLYHQSVTDFLSSEEQAQEFWIDTVPAHQQVAKYYQVFSEQWTKCDDYGLHHLVAHLIGARMLEELWNLAHSHSWMQAQRILHGGSYVGYLANNELLWSAAEEVGPSQLGMQVRCALNSVSVASSESTFVPELLIALVRDGLWTPEMGLSSARRLQDGEMRAEALIGVAAYLPAEDVEIALGEALDATREIEGSRQFGRRTEVLGRIVPHLPPSLHRKALDMLLQCEGTSLTTSLGCIEALIEQAAYLPQHLFESWGMLDWDDLVKVIAELIPHLPPEGRTAALAEAKAAAARIDARDWDRRVLALTALAPHLPSDERCQVLAEMVQLASVDRKSPDHQILGLARLAPYLPPRESGRVQDEIIRLMPQSAFTFWLDELVPVLSPDQRRIVVRNVLANIRARIESRKPTTIGPHEDMSLLEWDCVVHHLPPDMLVEALDIAAKIPPHKTQASALVILAPCLPPSLLENALSIAHEVQENDARARAMAALAVNLPSEKRAAVLAETLTATGNVGDAGDVVFSLSRLATWLSADQQTTIYQRLQDTKNKWKQLRWSRLRHGWRSFREGWAATCTIFLLTWLVCPFLVAVCLVLIGFGERTLGGLFLMTVQVALGWISIPILMLACFLLIVLAPTTLRGTVTDWFVRLQFYCRAWRVNALPEQGQRYALERVIRAVEQLKSSDARVAAFGALGPALAQELSMLGDVLPKVVKQDYSSSRARTLLKLTRVWAKWIRDDPDSAYSTWQQVLHTLVAQPRKRFLRDIVILGPVIDALGGSKAMEEVVSAVYDAHEWWP